jgi:glycosyltransferase involved in cell wall biosynthesis
LGGAATRAYNVAKGLTLNGCKVTVLTAVPHYPHGNIPKEYRWRPIKVEQMDNFKIIRTFMPPTKSEGFFKRLILKAAFAVSSLFACPVVGTVDSIWASSWVPGYVYSQVKRKKLAVNVDDLTLEDLIDLELVDKNSLLLKLGVISYRLFFVKADLLTPISKGYFEIMVKKYCVKPDRIHLIRGGVDLSTFKPQPRSLNKPKGRFVILYSGAFSVAYDFKQIIQAARITESIDKSIEFIIQGTGELLSEMRGYVNKTMVHNVKIINAIYSRSEVANRLGEADVLILPLAAFYKSGTPYRGMSSKLYEYQAVGKPIIVCSRGVPANYVLETRSGIVVESGDPDGLAKAVLYLKRNPDIARAMGRNGRTYVETEASISAIGLKMKNILECEANERQQN